MYSQLRNTFKVRIVLVVLACLGLFGNASGQRGGGSITPDSGDPGTGGSFVVQGTVYTPEGHRMGRPIRVRLYTPSRGDITTMTDDNGNFSFRRLSAGTYSIVIDLEKEYEPVNQQLNIVQAMRGGGLENNIPVQIRLKPRLAEGAAPGVVSAEFANVPRSAVQLYEKALSLAQAGQRQDAIEQLIQATKVYSRFMLAFNELGVQYMKLGELNKADESLLQALTLSPDNFTPLVNHGVVLVLLRRFAEAEVPLRKAIKINDRSAVPHYYLGRALAYQGNFNEGEKELSTAVKLGGEEMKEAHRYLGALYHARGEDQKAIAELENYLKVAPKAEDAAQVKDMIRQLKNGSGSKP